MIANAIRHARNHGGYDNEPGWKKDANGALVIGADGNPVYVDSKGAEKSMDIAAITRLNGEAAGHRTRAETAEGKLTALETKFKDIDPEKAREALVTVGKLKGNELVEAGKLDEIRAEVTKALQPKIDEAQAETATVRGELNGLRLTTAFQGSKYIAENLVIPHDIAQAQFGKHFVYENGKFVAKGADGNPIYSGKNAGQLAEFDEAMEMLVKTYPSADKIVKGANNQGSGNDGKGGGGQGGVVTLNREAFAALPPNKQAEHAAGVRAGTHALTD